MIQKLFYVELKTGFNDNGPGWIGNAYLSKSGQTIYFNALILKGSGKGNCHEIESGIYIGHPVLRKMDETGIGQVTEKSS